MLGVGSLSSYSFVLEQYEAFRQKTQTFEYLFCLTLFSLALAVLKHPVFAFRCSLGDERQ
jgi:hypothetical protein